MKLRKLLIHSSVIQIMPGLGLVPMMLQMNLNKLLFLMIDSNPKIKETKQVFTLPPFLLRKILRKSLCQISVYLSTSESGITNIALPISEKIFSRASDSYLESHVIPKPVPKERSYIVAGQSFFSHPG